MCHHTPRLGQPIFSPPQDDEPSTHSPDLAPCNFFLFPTVKNQMHGWIFDMPEEAIEMHRNLVYEIASGASAFKADSI